MDVAITGIDTALHMSRSRTDGDARYQLLVHATSHALHIRYALCRRALIVISPSVTGAVLSASVQRM